MNEQLSKKNIIILIVISFVVLFGLIISYNLLQSKSQPQTKPTPTIISNPTPTSITEISLSPIQKKLPIPKSKLNVPTYTPDKGQGVDINSQIAQESISEIDKLSPYLPYLNEYKFSNDLMASIVVPTKKFQDIPWILTVQIFGIDYQVPKDSKDYQLMKSSFLEAANAVFEWMKSYGVDPQKVIIKWGDKEFIQKQAEEWFASQ